MNWSNISWRSNNPMKRYNLGSLTVSSKQRVQRLSTSCQIASLIKKIDSVINITRVVEAKTTFFLPTHILTRNPKQFFIFTKIQTTDMIYLADLFSHDLSLSRPQKGRGWGNIPSQILPCVFFDLKVYNRKINDFFIFSYLLYMNTYQ